MFDAITAAAVRLQSEPGVRAVVLHGEGKSFCSGLDFMAVAAAGENGNSLTAPLDQPSPNYFQRAAYEWIRVPVPVIAAIHGNCFGGGLQIALAADIRVCAADAKLSVMETRWGLIPDMAITRTLTRLTGIDVAKELTYTARIIDGTQARELGLVTRTSEDPLGDARTLAAEIATKSPDAIRAAKRLFDQAWSGTPEETLGLEAALQRELIGKPNQIAAVTAGLTRQPAEFVDPAQ
jgi:enoyl-CoA hydratase/carnithine racemase